MIRRVTVLDSIDGCGDAHAIAVLVFDTSRWLGRLLHRLLHAHCGCACATASRQ